MPQLKSTMGAPLTDDEMFAILDAWAEVLKHAEILIRVPRDDQPAQLNAVAEMVGLISSFRSAVHNGWHYANKRAWPSPVPVRRERSGPSRGPRPLTNAEALAQLGLSEDEFNTILDTIKESGQ